MHSTNNKKWQGRVLLFLILTVIVLLPLAALASDSSRKTVRVGWYDSSFCYFDRFGRRCGIDYEYQQKISAYTGWSYEYVEGSWPTLFQMLKDGEIDLLSDVSYKPDRVEFMFFPELPMGSESYYIYIDIKNRDITADNPSSLNGKRIGVNQGSVQEGFLKDWMEKNQITLEIIPMVDEENVAMEKVIRGEIDGFASIYTFSSEQKVIPVCRIGSSEYYYAVNRNRPDLLAELNMALAGIQDEDPFFNQRLNEERLYNSRTNAYLTPDQEDWIRNHSTIRIGYREDFLPFCQTDRQTGMLTGALKDYLAHAMNNLRSADVHFETIPYESIEIALKALKAGEIDCVFPVYLNSYDAEQMGVRLTNPAMKTEINAVMPLSKVQPLSRESKLVFTGRSGDPNIKTFIMDRYPESSLLTFDSREDYLDAVRSGKADCAILSNYRMLTVEDVIRRFKLFSVPTGESLPLSFAVNRDDRNCYFLLNKTVVMTQNEDMDSALASYVESDRKITFALFLRDNWIGVVIVLFVVFFIIIVLLLQKMRAEKTGYERQRMIEEALIRELQQKEQLNSAMKMVNTDPLTGVKSKHAYNEAEERIDRRIEEGSIQNFGVIVFDLNDLKRINDQKGHEAGDEYIQSACRLICTHFKHSPVFRIGGDEFVAILEGEDYWNQEDLLENFEKIILGNLEHERIVIAFGCSNFDSEHDSSIRKVFERADAAMYKEKSLLKNIGSAHKEESAEEKDPQSIDSQTLLNVRRHILIAEDMDINREVLRDLLQNDYDILYASDGVEALEMLRNHKNEIALLLLDLLMPNKSGREVIMEMQVDEELVSIPIIVLTVDQEAELDSLRLGAMDFIPKPYPDIEIIKARIAKCIELSENRELIQRNQRDKLTSLYNPEYFMRYVDRYDRIYTDSACDAFICEIEHYEDIRKQHGEKFAAVLVRSIGISIQRLARKTGGIGCRKDGGSFITYWPHKENCREIVEAFASNVLMPDKELAGKITLRYGVFVNAQTEKDLAKRFDHAKSAAYNVPADSDSICGFYNA